MGRLQGKVVFITGAGSGIARAAALLFTQEGAKVAIAELKPELGRASEQAVRAAGGKRSFSKRMSHKKTASKTPSSTPLLVTANWTCCTIAPAGPWRKIAKLRTWTCGCGSIHCPSIC